MQLGILNLYNILYKIYFFINTKILRRSFFEIQLDLANKMNWTNYKRLSNSFNEALKSKDIEDFRDKFKTVCNNDFLLSIAIKNQFKFYEMIKDMEKKYV